LSVVNRSGRITGLIGPNGAGKTTTFNACSGLVAMDKGQVAFDGKDISKLAMPARAQRGLGRTFQTVDLLDSYSARDNVRLAAEAALAGRRPVTILMGRRTDAKEIERRSADALDTCGLVAVADKPADLLSNRERRLLSLARCLAAGFRIVMLDEPSAGLDARETAEFGTLLTSIVKDRGLGVVLVEHDMSLVMRVCDEVYVLDFGKEVMHGTPTQVQNDPAVRAAYLGEEPVVAQSDIRLA
jgi:ABC-type branched-subunit amino acid transport system ATPase component